MFKQYKKIVYAAAMIAGIVAIAAVVALESNIVTGLLYFLLGAIFGFFWPREEWRWGLCISLPIVGLLGLSILFAGWGGNIKNDLFFLLAILVGSTAGGFSGSFIRGKFKPVN